MWLAKLALPSLGMDQSYCALEHPPQSEGGESLGHRAGHALGSRHVCALVCGRQAPSLLPLFTGGHSHWPVEVALVGVTSVPAPQPFHSASIETAGDGENCSLRQLFSQS